MGNKKINQDAIVLTIAQNKGGVAKTTTALNVACGLAKKGFQVLLIDLDSQASLTRAIGIAPEKYLDKSIVQVLQKKIDIKEACESINDNLDIVPSNSALAEIESYLKDNSGNYFLQDAVETIKSYYDFIIIDTAPSTNIITKVGIMASTYLIIPIQCEYMALEQTTELINAIEQYKKNMRNTTINIDGVLLTMAQNTLLSNEIEQNTRNYFKDKVFKTKIRRNVKIAEAPAQKVSIFDYDNNSTGADDYENLVQEIISRYAN